MQSLPWLMHHGQAHLLRSRHHEEACSGQGCWQAGEGECAAGRLPGCVDNDAHLVLRSASQLRHHLHHPEQIYTLHNSYLPGCGCLANHRCISEMYMCKCKFDMV